MADATAVAGDQGAVIGPAARLRRVRLRGRAAARRALSSSWPPLDLAFAVLLAAGTVLVHDVGYLLTLPYWTDEAWVAISTRLPLHELPSISASTPVGWSLLLRLVPFGGQQGLRLLPLAFAALTVIAAYGYVRTLPWPTVLLGRLAAVLAAVVALAAPTALARDDLKQYTADAFVTLVVLWVAARGEAAGSLRSLVRLAVVVVVGFLFSAVAAFTGAAAFGGLLVVALLRRRWRSAGRVAAVGVSAGVGLGLLFLVFYRPGVRPGLHDYWAYFYLPINRGWGPSWDFLMAGGRSTATGVGLPSVLLLLVLGLAGVLTTARLGRPASAVQVPLLLAEMIVLSALRQYPLFDLRTSHFLTIAIGVTAAIGLAGGCRLLARINPAPAVALAIVALGLFLRQVEPGFRGQVINAPAKSVEDLRTPTEYVAAHRRPGDIVVVNELSSWGFCFYWLDAPGGGGRAASSPVTANLQGFITVLPAEPNILFATDRSAAAVAEVMSRAAAALASAGPGARIWFVHQHTLDAELQAYAGAASEDGWQTQNVIPGALDLLTGPA